MQIDIGVPDENGRLEIFRVHTRNMKVGGCAGVSACVYWAAVTVPAPLAMRAVGR